MKIINILENNSIHNKIKCEHGLSTYLEVGQYKIIYDTGQTNKFINNAIELGINLSAIDYVILSHGHYDHTGGLPAFLQINSKAKIILHPNGLRERFSCSSKMIKSNGIPWRLEWQQYKDRILFINETQSLFPGLWIVTQLANNKKPVLNDRLVFKPNDTYIPDPFEDEIVIVAQENNQTILLTGCAHNGIINILKTTQETLQIDKYSFVGGGLHLNSQTDTYIKNLLDNIKPYTIDKWGLNHCTGQNAINIFEQNYPDKVIDFSGGSCISFD
nr:MBL fold metallo-hydrolase [uncultured Carboxylicivirga sp.]